MLLCSLFGADLIVSRTAPLSLSHAWPSSSLGFCYWGGEPEVVTLPVVSQKTRIVGADLKGGAVRISTESEGRSQKIGH